MKKIGMISCFRGVDGSAVSREILALEKKGLLECLTPDDRMGRYYRATETGKKVVEILQGNAE
ncbi:MAG: hypothetical protein ABFC24_04400 [Methanoregulaceae archaeon]